MTILIVGGGCMASDFGLKIGVEGEKEFKSALTEINNQFKVLKSEMNLATSAFDKNEKSVEALSAKNEVLNKQIEAQKQKIETLRSALQNSAESFGENDKRTQNWQVQLNNAEAALNAMEREVEQNEKAIDEMGDEMDDTEGDTKDFSKAIEDSGETADDAKSKFESFKNVIGTVAKATAAAVAAIGAAAVAAGKALWNMANDVAETGDEIDKVTRFVMRADKGAVNPDVVGKSPFWIAEQAGVKVPELTKILIAKLPEPSREYPLSLEKLSPVLAYFTVKDYHQGFEYASRMLDLGGLGHSAVIHSTNSELCNAFGEQMKVGRIIVNSPSSQGAIGDIYNTNMPSLTLGCGSFGHNSTTSNVSSVNLINKKRIAKRRVNMQWFKIPPKIYFENDSIQYLEKMPDISRAFIVTDPMMVQLGNVDKILYYLRKRLEYCHAEIFSEVEPDPSVETIMRGVAAMNSFKPDVIIALGGGSAMDAAKGMWLFYEHPDTSFDGLKLKFMDIRKRTYHFPKLGSKAQLVCIPTTSGTGSEVTSFSVITDKANGNIKYPLADYELTPDVAIIDPQFVVSLPKSATADTGLDVLTHALEAYVSVLASDYTDGLAVHAIELVFEYLPRAYKNGSTDFEAREKMHNASCIAGLAFTNAFLGLNHSMAHKLGGEYHIPHGRANALLLPYVVEYNATEPTKFTIWPKYEKFIADEKYAKIARYLGLPAKTTQEGVQSLIKAIRDLMKEVNIPESIQACGIDEKIFMAGVDQLADRAYSDQCTTANPRQPLVSEIAELYKRAFYGK